MSGVRVDWCPGKRRLVVPCVGFVQVDVWDVMSSAQFSSLRLRLGVFDDCVATPASSSVVELDYCDSAPYSVISTGNNGPHGGR